VKLAYDLTAMPYLLIALGCLAIVGLFATSLILASIKRNRATKTFGDPDLVMRLESFDAAGRRALKGVLLVIALVAGFLALARPQWGRGQKLVPATNLDVVIVLDYSKSMYARDVAPSRIARAKAEIARLVRELPGARFGAVAFAGEPMSFPLTSDSAAIAQFFRQLEPNDMPVGGTAIAKSLERARELLARDPKSKDHVRVIVLVTDGEDLEGDPVTVARAAAQEKTRIDVVQIGGLTPEPIPDIGTDGKSRGFRKGDDGKTLTTELSKEGEEQLKSVAEATGGAIVRAQKGETGIDEIARGLKKMMREELAERVEIAFDEEYMWPLGLAVVLLVVEGLVPEAPLPKIPAGLLASPVAPKAQRKKKKRRAA
jgi:Ca-activated chloride channel homolog